MAIKITRQEFEQKFSAPQAQKAIHSKTVVSRIGESFTGAAQDISSGLQQSGQDFNASAEAGDYTGAFKASGRGALRTLGGVGRAIGGVISAPIEEGFERAPGLAQAVGTSVAPVVNPLMQKYEQIKATNPKLAKDIDDALGIANFFGIEAAGSSVAKAGVKVANTAGKVANTVGSVVRPVANTSGNLIRGTSDVLQMAGRSIKNVPGRIATNVAEKQLELQAVKSLPSKVAQRAVSNGVELADVETLTRIPKQQASALSKLASAAKSFSNKTSKTNPIEVVGKPIVSRIKELNTKLVSEGRRLGEAAKGLGKVTEMDLFQPVYNKIKSVQGLQGLKMGPGGKLDFTETALSTAETAADRKAIQSIYESAIKPGSGRSKHLLRQELFEVLGGKKKSLFNLTATQERAYQAIREGLSDVLESKSSTYKTLSNNYRKIAQPLEEMRKFMKTLPDATEDILDMQAGLLARRLTSNAASNPQIRNILRMMDEATSVKGKTRLSIESLQDFYNILDKYYDISGKTTLQGQVQSGVEKALSPTEALYSAAKEFAGVTPAVRQKALEEVLGDLFPKTSKR